MRRCARCKLEKLDEDFTSHLRANGGVKWDCYCRPCRAQYGRDHYARNKQDYIDKATLRYRARLRERVMRILDYFADHPCIDCGETDPVVLDFDHIAGKEFSISQVLGTRPWDAIASEIERCEVRCANCHRRRTAIAGGFARTRFANPDGQIRFFG